MRPAKEDYILVVVGSRESRFVVPDPATAKLMLFNFLDGTIPDHVTTLMSGRSPEGGVDVWVEEYAAERVFSFLPRPPDFEKFGKPNAYYQRNQQMADDGRQVWAFLGLSASLRRSGAMQTARMSRRQGKWARAFRFTPKGVVELKEWWK